MGSRLLEGLEQAEEKLDSELDRLERMDEDEIERLRNERMDQLRRNHRQKEEWIRQGHGEYREVTETKEFFQELKKSKRAVVHFYRPATWRCEIVDRHLLRLAPQHLETKFVKVNAEKHPFLAERLKIWMLPTVVLVVSGKTEHSIVGFDELGGDEFTTEQLESVFLQHDVVWESFCE